MIADIIHSLNFIFFDSEFLHQRIFYINIMRNKYAYHPE